MTTPSSSLTKTTTVAVSEAQSLDRIASSAVAALGGEGSFENAFAVADAMNSLSEAITPAMMKRFMSLRDSPLGFRTDKDPTMEDRKTGKLHVPYDESTVKNCVIEAVLRGVQPVGNQFNIIAKRTYITKEGFEYKLRKLAEFTEFKPLIGIPRLVGTGGAIVPCEATWKYKGKLDSTKVEIPIRVNEHMGADAIQGKAQRKFLKRVFEQATGCSSIPEGEVGDEPLLISAPAAKPPAFGGAPAPSLFEMGKTPEPVNAPLPETPAADDKLATLHGLMAKDGIDETTLLKYMHGNGLAEETLATIADIQMVSPSAIELVIKGWKSVLKNITTVAKAGAK